MRREGPTLASSPSLSAACPSSALHGFPAAQVEGAAARPGCLADPSAASPTRGQVRTWERPLTGFRLGAAHRSREYSGCRAARSVTNSSGFLSYAARLYAAKDCCPVRQAAISGLHSPRTEVLARFRALAAAGALPCTGALPRAYVITCASIQGAAGKGRRAGGTGISVSYVGHQGFCLSLHPDAVWIALAHLCLPEGPYCDQQA